MNRTEFLNSLAEKDRYFAIKKKSLSEDDKDYVVVYEDDGQVNKETLQVLKNKSSDHLVAVQRVNDEYVLDSIGSTEKDLVRIEAVIQRDAQAKKEKKKKRTSSPGM